jgi:hypothetical protein
MHKETNGNLDKNGLGIRRVKSDWIFVENRPFVSAQVRPDIRRSS